MAEEFWLWRGDKCDCRGEELWLRYGKVSAGRILQMATQCKLCCTLHNDDSKVNKMHRAGYALLYIILTIEFKSFGTDYVIYIVLP